MAEEKDNMKEGKSFTVKDSRIFSSTKNGLDTEKNNKTAQEKNRTIENKEDKKKSSVEEKIKDIPIPEVNFSNFILSLSTSALLHLGKIPDPVSQKEEVNLPLASHTINTIGMIQEKTEGNLTKDEKNMIDTILYDLKMHYVKMIKK